MWSIFKSVFAGSDHIEEGVPCQDFADFTITEKGIYVAALADGASSAAYGELAAISNVNAILNAFHLVDFERFWIAEKKEQSEFIVTKCREYINRYAKRIPMADPKDFAATVMFLVTDGKKILIGHIGDGIVCAFDNSQDIIMLSSPNNVNSHRDQTYFTVSQHAVEMMDIVKVNDIDNYSCFVMMSDGPEASFYDYTLNQLRKKIFLQLLMISVKKKQEK